MYADSLRANGQYEESLRQLEVASALDPLNPDHHLNRSIALSRLARWDEAEQAARRVMALDPNDPGGPWTLASVNARQGHLVDAVAGYLQAQRLDPNDHEVGAALARVLAQLDEHAAADAWLAESRRVKPGNLNADAEAVVARYVRGETAAALEGALALASREDEERQGNWSNATAVGCLAAAELGRTAELRSALERVGMVPRGFSVEDLQELIAPRVTLRRLQGRIASAAPCLFDPGKAGSAQRAQLLETLVALQGADWAKERDQWFLDGVLREDRERIVAAVLLEPDQPGALLDVERRMGAMRWLGLAEDPRTVAWHQRAEAKLAELRAALPARLAADGLSLTP
jgi:tetratricopeptide (TPR) repeat protein